jgi:hypothetical protein
MNLQYNNHMTKIKFKKEEMLNKEKVKCKQKGNE